MADLTVRRGAPSSAGLRSREWDPFQRMQEMMTVDPLEWMGSLLASRGATVATGFVPAFEVRETPSGYHFKADIPGIEEKDLNITLTGDRLTVSGQRSAEQRNEGDRFYAYERSFGSFSRSFTLPEGIEGDQVQASLKDGVLTLLLPKKPEVQPRKIAVGANAGKKTQA